MNVFLTACLILYFSSAWEMQDVFPTKRKVKYPQGALYDFYQDHPTRLIVQAISGDARVSTTIF